jgi:hypothetical protein
MLLLCAFTAPALSISAQTPSITITPGMTDLVVNQTLQYTAKVTGLTNTTVTWEVSNIVGGNAANGTISKTGLYTAPATLENGDAEFTIAAVGSDGKTRGIVDVFVQTIGPTITSINPNPIAPGKYFIEIHGTGFKTGASVRNGTETLATMYGDPEHLDATGEQSTLAEASFQVQNPGSTWGPVFKVPFKTTGTAPVVTPSKIFVHLGDAQMFTAPGATLWSASAGTITQTGGFLAPAVMPASNLVTISATGPGGTATAVVTLAGGADQTITPKSPSIAVGQKLQFTSAGATVWTAKYGTITSTGLYTAPTVWPVGGVDQITANGTQGWATDNLSILPPVPTITSVGAEGHIPLGLFSVTVSGTNFSPGSGAEILGVPLKATYQPGIGRLQVTGFFGTTMSGTLKIINGNQASQPFPVQIGYPQPKVSAAAAHRFLEQAAFGPSPNDANLVQELGFSAWLNYQFSLPQYSTYSNVTATYGGLPEQFLTNAVEQPDQLRQRVAFALSQIFVTSLDEISNQSMISYQDMLLADAFTNYAKIMNDVTLSPAMGQYLNMANNAKADPAAGSLANENFAREMMQLFTLGTSLLNPDGTVQVDSSGFPLPTYTQFQVTEFARVYTGYTYAPAAGQAVVWNAPVSVNGPMVPYPAEHDPGSKQLLYGYVSPAGISPQADLSNAINNILYHPNVGPFVATQLIQHLVKSNPSPAYVSRVAAAFDNNGSGVRADMKAVITAILLDPEARANDEGGNDQPTDGHLQEPALFIAGMVRAFGGTMNDYNYYAWDLQNLDQNIFSPPSVFNYYAPNYGVPGTTLMGGEFQIDSPNAAVLRANEVSGLFGAWDNSVQTYGPGTSVDLTPYLYYASNPQELVNALDLTLTHGVMPAPMKQAIITAVEGETGGNLRRVQRAIYLILTSSYYNVWH